MPVNMGKEGEGGTYEGLTGNFMARPSVIADKLVEGKEGRPDALRVTFEVAGREDAVSLFVPLHESAADRLRPFIPDVPDDVPTDEAGMRSYLAANLPGRDFLVYASNGSVRGVTAPEGKQRVRLTGLNKFSRQADGQARVRFFTETKDHETVTFTVRHPDIVCKVGATPEEDDIGPAKEFNPNPYLFEYLIAFGLDWKRFEREVKDAYEQGRLFTRLGLDGPEEGFFSDPNDLTEELFQATHRHSPNRWCEVEIVDHKQYGLGPKRGAYSHIEFTPVIVEGGSTSKADAEFEKEKLRMMTAWDVLTQIVTGDENARLMAGTQFTRQGRALAACTLKPLILKYPDAVLRKNQDGTPYIEVPPKPDTWNVNGMVAAACTAERLCKDGKVGLIDLNDAEGTAERVVEWASDALAWEWQGAGYTEEAEVL